MQIIPIHVLLIKVNNVPVCTNIELTALTNLDLPKTEKIRGSFYAYTKKGNFEFSISGMFVRPTNFLAAQARRRQQMEKQQSTAERKICSEHFARFYQQPCWNEISIDSCRRCCIACSCAL